MPFSIFTGKETEALTEYPAQGHTEGQGQSQYLNPSCEAPEPELLCCFKGQQGPARSLPLVGRGGSLTRENQKADKAQRPTGGLSQTKSAIGTKARSPYSKLGFAFPFDAQLNPHEASVSSNLSLQAVTEHATAPSPGSEEESPGVTGVLAPGLCHLLIDDMTLGRSRPPLGSSSIKWGLAGVRSGNSPHIVGIMGRLWADTGMEGTFLSLLPSTLLDRAGGSVVRALPGSEVRPCPDAAQLQPLFYRHIPPTPATAEPCLQLIQSFTLLMHRVLMTSVLVTD